MAQDGELVIRSFAEFNGIEPTIAPPYLMAGDVSTNAVREGATVRFSVYYYDVNALEPAFVNLVVNGRTYAMQPAGEVDYGRPVLFEHEMVITDSFNDFHFVASNGHRERRIPQDHDLPGPFLTP